MSVFMITGATGKLAPPIIDLLATRGDRILLTSRNKAKLDGLAERYGRAGEVETAEADALDPISINRAADTAVARFGRLDGLIHLVGGFAVGPLFRTEPAAYEELWRSNFLSAVIATHAVLPHLGEGGRLVYFATPLATEPLPAFSAYGAAKAALLTWMRSIAHEVKRKDVHANAVVMTIADTEDVRAARPHLDFDHTISPELVAPVVGFLTSEAADGLYGSCVPVLNKFEFSSALAGPPPGRGGPPGAGGPGGPPPGIVA
ncbi:NAD(P)-dependent dehydrogenase (short-subunit alcohol dehydrogenase family) [Actinoplanes campanulatus]|uniref:NAD(P)-dependent dehydrogenase (Short-subunit alcohol dehydrogenase family) n=1 Tax=Actinoplanes campanulatus TaxID=113559 RepID=A0A7W5ABM7_9ACTN|nr:SDR family oxidoreductase [Actinoplanes campanulatus]MBB3092834.1 NAD(P)-dependent dehydrogenase (short-subunit alcohol dehydrogenase family) [Actinoplanes campanulatus]GGM99359.1 short-chain dehydrogenase [Actinoplanes campanulatus]GID34068.1 short-chain dehydrogenase [Actinoplanes campanulatus]